MCRIPLSSWWKRNKYRRVASKSILGTCERFTIHLLTTMCLYVYKYIYICPGGSDKKVQNNITYVFIICVVWKIVPFDNQISVHAIIWHLFVLNMYIIYGYIYIYVFSQLQSLLWRTVIYFELKRLVHFYLKLNSTVLIFPKNPRVLKPICSLVHRNEFSCEHWKTTLSCIPIKSVCRLQIIVYVYVYVHRFFLYIISV
jgi:hypothetical protein